MNWNIPTRLLWEGLLITEIHTSNDNLLQKIHNTIRINFSFSNKEEIETGVKRLSDVIRDELYSK
jgi:DNA-binding transcriptional MocR family regulator